MTENPWNIRTIRTIVAGVIVGVLGITIAPWIVSALIVWAS